MRRVPAFLAGALIVAVWVAVRAGQPATESPEQDVRAVLSDFLTAFEHGEIEAMDAAFAEDATTFPRVIMSVALEGEIRSADYRRLSGLDPQMRALVAGWREGGTDPPYITLAPRDLEIEVFTDAALATFHLENGASLSRRTFVLARRSGAWRIVHLHASNVVESD